MTVDERQPERQGNQTRDLSPALRWLGLHAWVVLLILLVVVGSTWTFLELTADVVEEDPDLVQFDERLLLALREPDDPSDPLGPEALEEAIRDITALGGGLILIFVSANVAIFLYLHGDRRTALLLVVAISGGFLFSELFKQLIARPRPELVPFETHVLSYSFPSGHSMAAAATYLTLGTLLAASQRDLHLKLYIFALALLITFAVGFSRVYLGVHWPSDVLAGWTAGTVWALLVWVVARYLERRQPT